MLKKIIIIFSFLFIYGCASEKDKWYCYGHRSQNYLGMNYLSILEIDFKKEILKHFWGFNDPFNEKYLKFYAPADQHETPTREMFKKMKDEKENEFDIFLVKKHNEDAVYVRFDIVDINENKIRYIIEKDNRGNILKNTQKGKYDVGSYDYNFGGLTTQEKYRVTSYECSKSKNFNPY